MAVSVEKVSKVERRLTVVVPLEKVEEAYKAKINLYAKQANIKGFRPGKAPISFIQQRFGTEARKEALNDVVQGAVEEALTEAQLRPITMPQVEPKLAQPDQPLEFTVSFEVIPEIDAIQYSSPSIEKYKVDITAEDIDHVVQQLLKQHTKWNVVQRCAQLKDRVVIDYYATFEGKEDLENKIQSFPIELGSKVMIPGFEDGLIGAAAGEERKLNLHFPQDFGVADKAGKPVDFNVQIKQVFEADTPVLNAEFIQKLGIKNGSEEDLQKQIRQTLEQERDRLVKDHLKDQVFGKLLEENPIEVPNSMIAREAKNIHDEIYQHKHHDHDHHSEDEMKVFNDIAKKRVALGLLLAEYAKQSQIKADEARVTKRIAEIATAYESPQEVIAWLSSNERRGGIEAQVLEDQIIEKLMEQTTVTEKAMSYAELKGMKQ